MKKIVFAFFVSLMMLPAMASAETKVGVIDTNYIMAKTPEREAIQETLTKEFDGRKNQLERELKKLEDDRTKYVNNAKTMSDSQRTTTERDLKKRSSDFKLKEEAYQEDFKRRSQEEMKKLGQKLQEAVTTVAKNGGFDMLVDRRAVPYIGPGVQDVSDQVLQELSK
ncbi:OmpH family outer membrane protein [Kangiella sediminilitoris]|uniref:Outer membrane chaperone Skp (OmpH) n=1 Tax=Kangiella sediminilitoris TaxID=1144748 RepID=A0A1B3BC69_9GAMM|nr:OmpH family outer membrane protein [Kangiella sediminilitoris]AOE50355.1 Outer membrane chaperone Skp (OmpH) [Kangiella sediminilitoris]